MSVSLINKQIYTAVLTPLVFTVGKYLIDLGTPTSEIMYIHENIPRYDYNENKKIPHRGNTSKVQLKYVRKRSNRNPLYTYA